MGKGVVYFHFLFNGNVKYDHTTIYNSPSSVGTLFNLSVGIHYVVKKTHDSEMIDQTSIYLVSNHSVVNSM